MRIMKVSARALARALVCLAVPLLAGCATPSFEKGVTRDQVPVEAPMVFAGAQVSVIDWVGTIDDKEKRAGEVKAIADDMIRFVLTGAGFKLVCTPPAEGRYTVLDVKVEYKAYEPLVGGWVSTVGELRENDRVLMRPQYFSQMTFLLPSYAVKGNAMVFASLIREDLQLRFREPTPEQTAARPVCDRVARPAQEARRTH
ncbi:MAG: hypothetical protein ACM30I_11345 [Gemmatimonas sp.]